MWLNKITDSKTSVDYLHLAIQSLVDNKNIVNNLGMRTEKCLRTQ